MTQHVYCGIFLYFDPNGTLYRLTHTTTHLCPADWLVLLSLLVLCFSLSGRPTACLSSTIRMHLHPGECLALYFSFPHSMNLLKDSYSCFSSSSSSSSSFTLSSSSSLSRFKPNEIPGGLGPTWEAWEPDASVPMATASPSPKSRLSLSRCSCLSCSTCLAFCFLSFSYSEAKKKKSFVLIGQ